MKKFWMILLAFACAQMGFGQLSGPLSGTLGPGLYHVIDTISVESSDTLRLLPGTTFTFDGPYNFKIYGILLAEGTETDSIVFTTDTLANPARWRGLRFYGSGSSGSCLAYCLIENGLALGTWPDPNSFGGGVYLDDTSPSFAHCVFASDSAQYDGGGVYCSSSFSSFTNCSFIGNSSDGGGGAVSCSYSSPNFLNCRFIGNRTHGGGAQCMLARGTQSSRTASSPAIRRIWVGLYLTPMGISPTAFSLAIQQGEAAERLQEGGGFLETVLLPTTQRVRGGY